MIKPGLSGSKIEVVDGKVVKIISLRDYLFYRDFGDEDGPFSTLDYSHKILSNGKVRVEMPYLRDHKDAHLLDDPKQIDSLAHKICMYFNVNLGFSTTSVGLDFFLESQFAEILRLTSPHGNLYQSVLGAARVVREFFKSTETLGAYPVGPMHGDFGFRNILVGPFWHGYLIDHTYQPIMTPLFDFVRLMKSGLGNKTECTKKVLHEVRNLNLLQEWWPQINLLFLWDTARWAPIATSPRREKSLTKEIIEATEIVARSFK